MEKTVPEMINMLTLGGCPIVIDVSSTDYSVAATAKVKGISCISGTVIYVDIKNERSGATVSNVPLRAGVMQITGIMKIYNAGTDAAGIVLWVD
jgi:hypothetical protein